MSWHFAGYLFSIAFTSLLSEGYEMNATAPAIETSNGLQFSLRSLLIALGATCVLLAPIHWFGMPYVVSVLFSVLLVVICTRTFRSAPAGTVAIAVMAAIVGFVLAIALLVFFFHAVLNAIACAVLVPFKPRPRVVDAVLVSVMAIVYGIAFSQGVAKHYELQSLRVKYPFESITPRLAFERSRDSGDADLVDATKLSPAIVSNLDAQDEVYKWRHYSRAAALRQLHEDSSAEFARAAGFGFMRMPSLTSRLVYLAESKPLSLPSSVGAFEPRNVTNGLYNVHRAATEDFVSPERAAYVKSRDAVAGFEAHGFNALNDEWDSYSRGKNRKYNPVPKGAASEPLTAGQWQVIRLELVGLLRAAPRVYIAEKLPPLDQIAEAPHRPLNEFEERALAKLVSQEDIVVDQQLERIQMVGALRAGKSCLECHEGERGKLLGAFSYEIVPLQPGEETTAAVH